MQQYINITNILKEQTAKFGRNDNIWCKKRINVILKCKNLWITAKSTLAK